MSKAETTFRKTITRFGGLPGILVPLGYIGLNFCISVYHSRPIIINSVSHAHPLQIINQIILQALILGFGGIFLSYSSGTIIKYLYYKPRPIPRDTSTLWKRINAGSMPSIHSSNALITAFALFHYGLYIDNDNDDGMIMWAIILLFYYLSIAFSRITLQKHYPIDVLAGTGLGVSIILTLVASMDWIISLIEQIVILLF